jgi:hypothetical protein
MRIGLRTSERRQDKTFKAAKSAIASDRFAPKLTPNITSGIANGTAAALSKQLIYEESRPPIDPCALITVLRASTHGFLSYFP